MRVLHGLLTIAQLLLGKDGFRCLCLRRRLHTARVGIVIVREWEVRFGERKGGEMRRGLFESNRRCRAIRW